MVWRNAPPSLMPSRSALKMQQILWPVCRSSCLLHPSMRCFLRMAQMIHRFFWTLSKPSVGHIQGCWTKSTQCTKRWWILLWRSTSSISRGVSTGIPKSDFAKKHQTYHRATVHGRNTRKTNTRLPRCKPRCESNLKVLYADATAKLGAYYVCPDFGTCYEGGFKHTRCIDLLN